MNIDQLAERYKATLEEIAHQSRECERLDHKGREAWAWSPEREEYVATRRLLLWLKRWNEERT